VHGPDGDGQAQEGEQRFLAVEQERLEAEPPPAQVAEELAEGDAERHGERRPGAEHLGHGAAGAPGRAAVPEPEREDRERQPVADVAHDHPEEHREEHRDEWRRVDRAVRRERHHLGDHLERPEEARVMEHHRRRFPVPVFARHRFHHDPPAEPRRHRLDEARVPRLGNPPFQHETARRRRGPFLGGEPQQAVLRGGPRSRQARSDRLRQRVAFAVESRQLGVERLQPGRQRRTELPERLAAASFRHRQFVHPRLGEEPLDPGRVRRRHEKHRGEFTGGEWGRLEDEFLADGLRQARPQPGHHSGVLATQDEVVAVGPGTVAGGQQPAEGPDELEQPGGLGALLLQHVAPGVEPLRITADPAELPEPTGNRRGRL